jgi:hypothetical protein
VGVSGSLVLARHRARRRAAGPIKRISRSGALPDAADSSVHVKGESPARGAASRAVASPYAARERQSLGVAELRASRQQTVNPGRWNKAGAAA